MMRKGDYVFSGSDPWEAGRAGVEKKISRKKNRKNKSWSKSMQNKKSILLAKNIFLCLKVIKIGLEYKELE